jgi:poly(3-hydroxybutyrate) depolymerase
MRDRFHPRRVMLTCVMLVAALLCQATGADPGRFVTWTYKEASMGLYLPANLDKPVPVVMFLHGCRNDPVDPGHWIIQALNAIEPTAVFLPTAPETQNTQYPCADWGGTYDAKIRSQMQNALHELDSVIERFGLDLSRQYLYGESMGGEGVYRLLMDYPTRFAGAVDVAGYTANKGAAQMAKTPLWIVIGAEDEMSPVEDARAIHAAIEQAGGTMVKYTEYPGLGHVPAIEKARTDTALLTWLLGQQRSTGLQPGRRRAGLTTSETIFTVVDGVLRLSSTLPAGTRVTFADLQGRTLFVAETGDPGIRLPRALRGRVFLWSAENALGVASGKSAILP